MSKNVAVFVDVANVFYAAKAAGVDIDYVTLLKSASAGRDLVRAYAYTGLDPDNENQRNFHDFLRRSGYKVVSKDIRKYGDGKVKANLDIELVVDMMKTARNLDIAIVVSGDGDFAPAIRAVQEQGVRVEVISFRGNTSSDLIDVADIFTDITQLAKVEKGSSRSGRRVATDDGDLSMTEVPDKQTDGTGERSRGRGRGRTRDDRPAAATRSRSRSAETEPVTAVTSSGMPLIALPGEKLSRATSNVTSNVVQPVVAVADAVDRPGGEDDEELEAGGPRRRRRRGGRGRGRGRGEGTLIESVVADGPEPDADEDEDDATVDERPVTARPPRSAAFGSVWDSQLGVPTSGPPRPLADPEDFDEPEIPEYLIAERRSREQGVRSDQGRGGRGGRVARSGYSAAVDRERFGRGGGGGGGGGINRYPDIRPRERDFEGDRTPRPAPRSRNGDPWSEVPPELEALLRAQVANRPRPARPAPPVAASGGAGATLTAAAGVTGTGGMTGTGPDESAAAPRRRTARKPAATDANAGAPVGDSAEATAPPSGRTRTSAAGAGRATDRATGDGPAPRRRTTRKAASGQAEGADSATPASEAPKRRARASSTGGASVAEAASGDTSAAPKRRTPRKSATDPT
ncbi:MAG: NYN domain-containing protein [Chloroflexota bacterium]